MKFLYILTNLDSHSIQRYIANLVNDKNIFTLCTFHPNFLIQQPNQKKNAWFDLQLFEKKIKDLNIK